MGIFFTYNPFAIDGPGRPYRSFSAAQIWDAYKKGENLRVKDAVVGDFPQPKDNK